MKIHITNIYNFNKGDALVEKQHEIAEVGRSLGFLEMGIFSFPVETDTSSELHKRMDGILASLEAEDVVIIQLPSKNGFSYEQLLTHKIKAYRDTKVVFLLHDFQYVFDEQNQEVQQEYTNLFRLADAIVIPTVRESSILKKYGFTNLFYMDDIDLSRMIANKERTSFYIKKLLIDVADCVLDNGMDSVTNDIQNNDDVIHVGFGLHDKYGNYSVWVGTVIESIVENTSAYICFHILHDDTLTEKNRMRLIEVAERSGNSICFHFIDKTIFDGNIEQVKNFTIGTMFRIMLPELLSDISKIIYLDADIVVNRDIKELWDINISDYCLAAVPDMDPFSSTVVTKGDVKAERYFNAGVQYYNLEKIRQKGDMKTMVLDYLLNHPEVVYPDQDAINSIYTAETLLLDRSWNYFVLQARKNKERYLERRIYHYAGTRCIMYYGVAIDQLYYELISRTPWKDEVCPNILNMSIGRVVDRINQIENVLKIITSNSMKYIYYGEETFGMKNFYKLVPPKDGDYRVLDNPNEKENAILPCKKLINLQSEQENFVVFVLAEADCGNGIVNLENLGLKNETDFFVIQRLLPAEEGGFV